MVNMLAPTIISLELVIGMGVFFIGGYVIKKHRKEKKRKQEELDHKSY